MRWSCARALYGDDGATLDEIREGVKTLAETETNIKELLTGNEALSRELLQNGYQ